MPADYSKELNHIPFGEFANKLARLFKHVIDELEAVGVENDEREGVEIRPLSPITTKPALTDDDYRAFRSAFAGWADVDTDGFKKAIYESRQSSSPLAYEISD